MDIWIYSTSPSFSNATLARPMETPRKLNIVQNSPFYCQYRAKLKVSS